MIRSRGLVLLLLVSVLALAAGPKVATPPARGGETLTAEADAFLDTLSERTFHYFWDLSDPQTGLTPDRSPTRSFVSVGAVGFALTAYPIGAEHGWITRAQAAERVRRTLRFFWEAPQDSAGEGSTGYRGFFYHFLDSKTGRRFEHVELSTMDTALLLAGALFCESYFDRDDPIETDIRSLAESLDRRVDWTWIQPRPPLIALAWTPEKGFLPYDWRGLNETMILHLLALESPTHPVGPETWTAWTKGYRWGTFEGQEHLGFAPLFGHQYSQVWIDFRGIRDEYMRGKGIDYFENSRRATLAQRAYAIANPQGFRGYGPDLWGLSACDGPLDATLEVEGRARHFQTYAARGASFTVVTDDGTVAPTALGGSIPFAPRLTVEALMAIRRAYGPNVYSTYGFVDALNPTLHHATRVQHGRVVAGVGWFDTDYLGIDEGPMLAMIENYRTGMVWRLMRTNPHVVRGLRRAGFAGGWLDKAP
ncbi:MAG: Tat pathway signal protein [Candidatus Eisenbacteria bacterium]|uniref:Tat pathway signal protein n=1 Tax=Eiseniibacteriota bacterium TaxID=2212470 RepID=A0A538U164_UNCEI|nr:MAG: Tat pathway signal protein [Candidatus Eisenbacteria bacterium]